MVANGVKEEPVGKPVDAEGAVCIEDFRGDSATDDIARQAVIKDIVDIEQTGATLAPALHSLPSTHTLRLALHTVAAFGRSAQWARHAGSSLKSMLTLKRLCRGAYKLEGIPQEGLERERR